MDRPDGAGRRAPDERAPYGVQPQPHGMNSAPSGAPAAQYGASPAPYGVAPEPGGGVSAPYGKAPAPYGATPGSYGVPAFSPSAQALSPNRRSAGRRAAEGLIAVPAAIVGSLWQTLEEMLLTAALAAVPVGLFALLGYAIGGSTGAWLGAIVGVGVFYALRFFVLVGIATWGAGKLLTRRRRD